MNRITVVLFAVFCVFFGNIMGQTKILNGNVLTTQDSENIHIINKTLKKNTITNSLGAFNIPVQLQDTLVFSSIQHEIQVLIINQEIFKNARVVISLQERVNALDEVVVGKLLTGNIKMDVSNVDGEPMTSKKAGIPSFQGTPLTAPQRYLKDAGDLDAKLGGSLGGIGASVRLIPIINAITGRTKKMKAYVELEQRELLLFYIQTHISEAVFKRYPLADDLVMEFLYFASEQPDFLERCSSKNHVVLYEYLKEKLHIYYHNKNVNSD